MPLTKGSMLLLNSKTISIGKRKTIKGLVLLALVAVAPAFANGVDQSQGSPA